MQRKTFQKAISLVLSLVMLLTMFSGITVFAEDTVVYNATRITIHPGIDETHLNFSWHSDEQAAPATVRIKAENSNEWVTFTGESKAVATSESGHQEGYHDTFVKNCGHTCSDVCGHEPCTASQCYHGIYTKPYYNRVTVSGLEFGTKYTYQLGDGVNWSKEYTTKTADTDPSEDGFSYLVFGDSQTADQYYGDYMNNALKLATERFSDADFMMNLGDNVHENNERNYNAYYTAQDILASMPIAVVMGNHEVNLRNSDNVKNHPALTYSNPPAANDRQDYWFRYGDALFITFNSGPQTGSMFDDLDKLIQEAIEAHPDARWKILQTHQGFYSNNGGGKDWRRNFVPVISKYDIDMVFVGHHHLYTRTESMLYSADTEKCSHESTKPDWNCAYCSGTIEPLGENDKTVAETFIAKDGTETNYTKTVERVDPEGITYMHLDSLTAEGHDQYYTGSTSLAPTTAYTVNTLSGQGAITRVVVTKDTLTTETYWINNAGTQRIGNSAPIENLYDDFIDAEPYDTYTIRKTTAVKDIEVTFDGGTERNIKTKRVNSGDTIAEPEAPAYTGKSFMYWSLDGVNAFNFSTPITEDITLTAVYGDIPATTTADLFVEAVNRGDSEIILEGDITLNNLGNITINSNTTIKSAEGEKYTITLDGNSRLTIAKGKKVTFDSIKIVIAATANTIADAYTNGTYITVGSGGNRADLYVYNSTIECLATGLGGSSTGIIASSKNSSSYAYFENCTVTSKVVKSTGSVYGQYLTIRLNNVKTTTTGVVDGVNAWFCVSSTKLIFEGTTNTSGWVHSSAKTYDFRNASVKAARNKENLIELSKIGSGTAVTNANYEIYYSTSDDAFSKGTAIKYTEPIADIDYETPIYVAIRYTGTSYYSTAARKICPEYIEGCPVATQDAFVTAIANGESLITLTANITLSGTGEILTVANTTIQSKTGEKYTITLDGNSRLRITTGKTATIKNVDFVIADTADIVSNGWTNGGYITVGSDNSKATLKMYNCNIECKSSSIGNNENSILRADRNAASSIYMENSAINAAIKVDEGALIGGANAVYTLRDSSLKVSPSNAWLCTSTNIILYGSSSYQTSAWAPSTDIADFRNVTVAAVRDNDNNIVLTKEGTGKAVTSDTYQIYYSTDEDAFSKDTATAYTEAITGIDANTTIYAAVKYGSKPWYSDAASYTLAIDETPEEPTVEGATILQSTDSEGNQDIRFSYNTGKIDESNPVVEYGMLISLSKFEVGELTLENAAANKDKINLSKVENVNITEASSFVASIGGVPTNLYTYKYRTVVYVKYADGSIEYSEEIERSVAGVAKSIIGYAYENRADDTLSALASELEALVESVDEGVVTLTAAGKANNGAAILAFLEENNDAISAAITKLGKK